MRGRTACPKCKNEILLDVQNKSEKQEVVCSKCNNKFVIKPKFSKSGSLEECSWEEHGEPRKTILSSIKPKSKKPIAAAIILLVVFCLGIFTSVLAEVFIETTMDVASGVGLNGRVKIIVTDIDNKSIENVNVVMGNISGFTNENGEFIIEQFEPGIQIIELSIEGYIDQSREIIVSPFFDSEHTVKLKEGDSKEELIKFDSTGCTLILIIFSVFGLIGTITCLKREHFDVAIAGSLIAILSFGFFFIGSILSIIAFVLIYKSKDEFENGKKGKIF